MRWTNLLRKTKELDPEEEQEIIDWYLDQGFSIIPIVKGKKRCALPSWKKYQSERASREQVYSWRLKGHDLAVVCGAVSGNLVVVDIDDPKIYNKAFGPRTPKDTLVVMTSKVGRDRKRHVYYRASHAVKTKRFADVDIQGEGAIVKIPPSKGYDIERWPVDEIEAWGGDFNREIAVHLKKKYPKMVVPSAGAVKVAELFRPAPVGLRHDRLVKQVTWSIACKLPREECRSKAQRWNESLDEPKDADYVDYQVDWLYDHPPYSYHFDRKPSPIHTEEMIERAEGLLEDPRLMERFIEDSGRTIVMDVLARKMQLLACVSAYGKLPLNLAILGIFSSGKTKTATTTASYFGVFAPIFGQTPKALIHDKGHEDEDGRYIVDLRNQILVFMETPHPQTMMMLKPLLSRDSFESVYKYVEKEGGLKTREVLLRGFPVAIFCAVLSRYIKEFTSRWLTQSPGTSVEKIGGVLDKVGESAADPDRYAAGDEFEAFKVAFDLLRDGAPYGVVIPYGPPLAKCFRRKRVVDMRFFQLFLSMIRASAILFSRQREVDDKGRILASLADYELAREVFARFERPTVYGVGENVLEFYDTIIKPVEWPARLNYELILDSYKKLKGEAMSRNQLRNEYLDPLERVGLIEVRDDINDARKKLILPTSKKYVGLIDDEKFKALLANKRGGSIGV